MNKVQLYNGHREMIQFECILNITEKMTAESVEAMCLILYSSIACDTVNFNFSPYMLMLEVKG